jgi:hypothetical protein
VATRFDNVGKSGFDGLPNSPITDPNPDLFMTGFYDRKVRELGLPSVTGVQRYIHVGFRQSGFIDLPENYLKLPIVDFEHPGIHPMQEFFDITYSGYHTFTVPDMQCAISWDSLKDFELFLESDNVLKYCEVAFIGPFSGLQ